MIVFFIRCVRVSVFCVLFFVVFCLRILVSPSSLFASLLPLLSLLFLNCFSNLFIYLFLSVFFPCRELVGEMEISAEDKRKLIELDLRGGESSALNPKRDRKTNRERERLVD